MFRVLFSWRCSSVLISREEGKRFASCPCCSACEARRDPSYSFQRSFLVSPSTTSSFTVSRGPSFPFHPSFQELPCYLLFRCVAHVFFFFLSVRFEPCYIFGDCFFPRLSIGFLQCTLPPPVSLLPVFCSAPLLGNRRAGSVHRLLSPFPFLFLSLVFLREGVSSIDPAVLSPAVASADGVVI